MSLKIISYDLGSPESSNDYTDLIDYIKDLGSWAKPHYSLWFVDTSLTTRGIRNGAKQYLDSNDSLFVALWRPDDWASYGLPNEVTDWLRSRG